MIQPSGMPARSSNASGLMLRAARNEHSGKLSDGSYLKATTSNCKIKLNSVIFVETDSKLDRQSREMDRFRVIEITHNFDDNKKSYQNEIIAVNADIEYFPIRDYEQPIAMPEVATVTDNADPENLGRVKVKFMWQKLDDHPQHKTSDWLRVQTPDAGSSDAVEKNRGFFFVPETGDQVMVGFEPGDPNRPFVMGSLYHKNNTGGVAENNKLNDHDNDYAVMWKGILLAYGRYSGGNTVYNHLPNGARVIELNEGTRTFSSWIRLKGEVVDKVVYPSGFVKDDWRKR